MLPYGRTGNFVLLFVQFTAQKFMNCAREMHECTNGVHTSSSMRALEVLNFPFVLFRLLPSAECTQILTLSGTRVYLPRIEAIFARFQFSDHIGWSSKNGASYGP